MSPEGEVRRIFDEAVELAGEERRAFLDRTCAGDEALRAEVEALLHSYEDSDGFLETPQVEVDLREVGRWFDPGELLVGERVRGWRLDGVIASGGMGTVYSASRVNGDETAALKLMRAGMASPAAMRRFQFEAEILGRLRHEGIARVLETGSHDAGSGAVPYFVMEHVEDGRPITEHARDLALEDRLALMAEVCDAVHHGHQKGIIHRDLKPSNILVDREGRPKIIDFGVARATDADLAVTTMATETGHLVGTLQYMSPEQCAGDSGEIDVRTDVYSLGVVLYELVCDALPYDVRGIGVVEAVRTVRDQPPRRPREAAEVPEDVETILLTALEKEPERRYQSAADLGADLRRFLNHESIAARPPSALYQMRMFARRNRGLVAGAALIATLLVASTAVTTTLAVREASARDALEDKSAGLEAVNRFFAELFDEATPGAGGDGTIRGALDRAAATVDERFERRPLIEAEIRLAIGTAYLKLGRYAEGRAHCEISSEIRSRLLGDLHRDTIESQSQLAMAHYFARRPAEAVELLEDIVRRSAAVNGDEHPRTVTYRSYLVLALYRAHRADEAVPIARLVVEQADDLPRDSNGYEPVTRESALNSLALALRGAGDYEGAVEVLRVLAEEMLADADAGDGPVDPGVVAVLNNLGDALGLLGRPEEAAAALKRAVELANDAFDDDHNSRLTTLNNYGVTLDELGRYDESEDIFVEVLRGRMASLGPGHPSTATSVRRLASFYRDHGKPDLATDLLEESLRWHESNLGSDNARTIRAQRALAESLRHVDRYDEAEPHYRAALGAAKRTFNPDDPRLERAIVGLGRCLGALNEYDESEGLLLEAHAAAVRTRGEEDPNTRSIARLLALIYDEHQRPEQAARWRAAAGEPGAGAGG